MNWKTFLGIIPVYSANLSYQQNHEIVTGLIAGVFVAGILFAAGKGLSVVLKRLNMFSQAVKFFEG